MKVPMFMLRAWSMRACHWENPQIAQLMKNLSHNNWLWSMPQGMTRRASFHRPACGSCLGGLNGRRWGWGCGLTGIENWLPSIREEFVVAIDNRGFEKISSGWVYADCALPDDQVSELKMDIRSWTAWFRRISHPGEIGRLNSGAAIDVGDCIWNWAARRGCTCRNSSLDCACDWAAAGLEWSEADTRVYKSMMRCCLEVGSRGNNQSRYRFS